MFITTKSTKRQSSWKPPNGFPSELKIKNSDTYTADIAARFQYIRDQMLLNENELTRVVRSLQCDLRQIKHAQAAATAQYSGWLAAAHLKLPKCTKLSANRETVTALKCKPTIVDFKTEVTKCGAQPRYKNFTINVDGWYLVEFKPCYWTTGCVNFQGEHYVYQNGSWTRINPEIVVSLHDLAHSFRFEDIGFFEYHPRGNPAYTDVSHNHMNIMADIIATMNEQATPTLPGEIKQTIRTANILTTAAETAGGFSFSNFWEEFKIAAFLIFLVLIALLIAHGCYALGCCGMLWNL